MDRLKVMKETLIEKMNRRDHLPKVIGISEKWEKIFEEARNYIEYGLNSTSKEGITTLKKREKDKVYREKRKANENILVQK